MNKILLSLGLAGMIIGSLNAKVYAIVNGEEITDKDMLFLQQAMPNVDFSSLPKEMQDKAVEQAIERKLLTIEAKKGKLEDTKEYKEALEDFKDTMVLELWMRKKVDDIKVSDGEINKYYNDNKDRLIMPESAHARHILVESEKEAKDIIKQLNDAKDKVEDKFIELAKKYSKDPSAANGGDLGFFAKDKMVPSFSKATFDLKENTYTKTPVKTDFGYHIIFLKTKKPQSVISYEEAKPRLEQELKLIKFREEVSKIAQDLRKKAKVEMK
ncbi:peptidylprolyl isomerase [Helicobacter sp. MIT 99-5507]|uniref:peptidylprolyl isomerase n=1 Tax=Helicobacter sp. MIT 99-5507 TaxID=152489 RepID=UPI000E1EF235|nr:peptidylprolyl isomerase [Helicobacter sp. MIT 99-5507]RDU56738.1 peptidylprolyl isomerase [Helicobacter sp. MIT 99-5507]